MAAVRQRFGRRVHGFAHKTWNRFLLKSHNKLDKSATRVSSLSAGFLLGDIKNGDLCGAESAADSVTVGASRGSYARVPPLIDIATVFNGNISLTDCGRNKNYPLRNIEKHLPRHLSSVKFRRTLCTFGSANQQLCWGHGQFVFIRPYSGNGTRSEPLYRTKTGYYEILEVTSNATQAQIKTAYYKQSFVYHPDRNAGSDEATVRFSEISEAYTVLGNKALRRKYDRGLLSQSDLVAPVKPSGKETPGSSAKQQTQNRRSVMGADGKGGVFDFDAFFKTHYNEQLQREKDIRVRKEEMLKKKQESLEETKMDRMLEIGLGLMLAMAMAIIISLKQR